MNKCKLILIEGIPGTGKSTMTQFLYEQLKQNGIPVNWYHEGLDNHFIWNDLDQYFNDDGYVFKENFEKYSETLIQKFESMKTTVEKNNQVIILDGNLFAGFTNVLFKSDCDDEYTLKYYKKIEEMINPLNPLLIYLDTNRVREHTTETWENRALWGKKVVIEAYSRIPHVKRSGCTGDNILHKYINPLHDQDLKYFKTTTMDKKIFNIDERKYEIYNEEILNYLELNHYPLKNDSTDINRYVGIYDNDIDQKTMFVKILDDQLVCDWGQMNMALNYVEPNIYNLRSYPIFLKFLEMENVIIGIETFGEQCFRRAGCHFKRVDKTRYEIRK